jgi:hypothetical protein
VLTTSAPTLVSWDERVKHTARGSSSIVGRLDDESSLQAVRVGRPYEACFLHEDKEAELESCQNNPRTSAVTKAVAEAASTEGGYERPSTILSVRVCRCNRGVCSPIARAPSGWRFQVLRCHHAQIRGDAVSVPQPGGEWSSSTRSS